MINFHQEVASQVLACTGFSASPLGEYDVIGYTFCLKSEELSLISLEWLGILNSVFANIHEIEQ